MQGIPMDGVVVVRKPVGITPLGVIHGLKDQCPQLANTKMTFAGRLDPMADGLLPILMGEERFRAQEYYQHSKVYESAFVCGLTSDTADALGQVAWCGAVGQDVSIYTELLQRYVGIHPQEYPVYASKPVGGKPLFRHAREGSLAQIDIPAPLRSIQYIRVQGVEMVPVTQLAETMIERISLVQGDFRQDLAIQSWRQIVLQYAGTTLPVVTIEVATGPGVYVRGLVDRVGKQLGEGALALAIRRSSVDRWTMADSVLLDGYAGYYSQLYRNG